MSAARGRQDLLLGIFLVYFLRASPWLPGIARPASSAYVGTGSRPAHFSAFATSWGSSYSTCGMIAKSTSPAPLAITKVAVVSPSGVPNAISSDETLSPLHLGTAQY